MATTHDLHFSFAGETSMQHGVFLATSIGSTTPTLGDEKSEIVVTKSPFKESSDVHYIKYDDPLEFQIIIVNTDGTFIDATKERSLKKWLIKNNRKWLQIFQPNLS